MLDTKVVLVTGGNRGVGYAIAEEFLAAGYAVAVTARNGFGPSGSLTVIADVTDPNSLDEAIAKVESELGPITTLVANAGITRDTLLMRMTDEDFEAVVDTNLTGVFRVLRRVSKSMIKAKYGRVILIGSVVGLLGSAGQVNYSATKSALVGMARSITRELGGRGITANVVAPGFIDTDMTRALSPDQVAVLQQQIPLGRFGDPNDVASAVRFLASREAGYITGVTLHVNGGMYME